MLKVTAHRTSAPPRRLLAVQVRFGSWLTHIRRVAQALADAQAARRREPVPLALGQMTEPARAHLLALAERAILEVDPDHRRAEIEGAVADIGAYFAHLTDPPVVDRNWIEMLARETIACYEARRCRS